VSTAPEAPGVAAWERDERVVGWVYGATLTGAAVVVATVKVATLPWQAVLYTAVAMAVVWAAHSYAEFVGHGGRIEGGGVGRRLRHVSLAELPVFLACVPALAAMALAAALDADLSGVGYAGVLAAVATMVLAASYAAKRSGAGTAGVVAVAVTACLVGVLLIAAKSALK
jgi:hypothetical protein